jgi:hypothetical protein
MSLAIEIYEKTEVGTTGSLIASSVKHNELESFQAIVAEFDSLQADGLINNLIKYKESQSGKHFIDCVQFRRIK